MELLARNPRHRPEARMKMLYLLGGLWVAGLGAFFISDTSNWGVLLFAACLSVFELIMQAIIIDTYKISMSDDGISITNGPNFLWGAGFEQLKAVTITDEARKLGIVISPKRLVFHKMDGDLYAIDTSLFDLVELENFTTQVRNNIQVKD